MSTTMDTVDINKLWTAKIGQFSRKIRQIVRGDDDAYQEGILGLREGLLRNPNGTDSYLLSAIKWRISHYRNSGKSIDNGPRWTYRKTLVDGTIKEYGRDVTLVYIDEPDSDFDYPDYGCPPDTLAVDRICSRNFHSLLDSREAMLVDACIQTYGRYFYDSKAMRMLGMGRVTYNRIKHSAHAKFIRAYGDDEEIQILDHQLAMSEMHE